MNLTLGTMNKSNVNQSINDLLSLAMLDMVADDMPSMSYREISRRTGLPICEVKSTETRAIKKLRNNPDAWNAMISLVKH
jgi:DNA-directed RNA polymerase specialized sigma24 family protein